MVAIVTPAAIDSTRRAPAATAPRATSGMSGGLTASTAPSQAGITSDTSTPGNCCGQDSSADRRAARPPPGPSGSTRPTTACPPAGQHPCCRHPRPPARAAIRARTLRYVRRASPSWRGASLVARSSRCIRADPWSFRLPRLDPPGRAPVGGEVGEQEPSARRAGWRSRGGAGSGSTARRRRTASRGPGRARPRDSATTGSSPRRNTASSTPIAKWAPTSRSLRRSACSYSSADVLLGRRHDVGLVAQRALAEREPHRGDVLLLAAHPDVPARIAGHRRRRSSPVDRPTGFVGLEPGAATRRSVARTSASVAVVVARRSSRRPPARGRVRSAYTRRSRAAAKPHV